MSALSIVEPILALSMQSMIGLYFIFSNTVMRALQQHKAGAQVMVLINQIILNPWFMVLFWGSALASVYFVITGSALTQLAGLIFLTGTFAVTLIGNVPLNRRLEAESDRQDTLLPLWAMYLHSWTRLNHIRTLSALISSLLLNLS